MKAASSSTSSVRRRPRALHVGLTNRSKAPIAPLVEGASRSRLCFTISLLVHGSLLLALAVILPAQSTLPEGFRRKGDASVIELADISELASISSAKKIVKARVADNAGDVLVKFKKEKPVEAPKEETALERQSLSSSTTDQARLGHRDGMEGSGPLGATDGISVSEKERYLFELKSVLEERRVYPRHSERMGETGSVLVSFKIHPDGSITEANVAKPSAFERLNQAALKLVSGLKRFRPLPAGASAGPMPVEMPIDYLLN